MELRGKNVNLTFDMMKGLFKFTEAFGVFRAVSELKVMGVIPEEYAEYFPDHCSGCGSENIMVYDPSNLDRNLKSGMCCNPKCRLKQGYALAELMARFGCKGLGENTCLKIYDAFISEDLRRIASGRKRLLESDTYVEILKIEWSDYPMSIRSYEKTSDFYYECQRLRCMPVTFPSMVAKLGLPELDNNALKLFHGVFDCKDLAEKIKSDVGVSQFCARRGFYDKMLVFWVANSLYDFAAAQIVFWKALRPMGMEDMRICITGRVRLGGLPVTKREFVDRCNMAVNVDGVQLAEVSECAAMESVDYIVCDAITNSAKCRAGLRREAVEKRKILITADEFYSQLERLVSEWKEKQQS